MNDYDRRLAMGLAHEANVLGHLRKAGWDAEPFGQGQLTPNMREHLRRYTPISPVRWMPDIIAAIVTRTGLTRIVYVDAKAGDQWRRTGMHGCQIRSLETMEAWERWTHCPVYFMFTDLTVITAERIRECGSDGPQYGNGSGNPYLLFPAIACESFASKFGAVRV